MNKFISLMLCLMLGASILTGCAGAEDIPYEAGSYTAEDTQITEVRIGVRDRQVEVIPSADGQIRIGYYENSKERYDISVSEDHVLTMTAVNDKEWKDYIGGAASGDQQTITLQVPDALLDTLDISTTNANISVAPLALTGDVSLKANGGNISFESLEAGDVVLDVKNGDISGVISGSYDDYAISCAVKKGETNLPASKESGTKQLTVTANNGDVAVEIQ